MAWKKQQQQQQQKIIKKHKPIVINLTYIRFAVPLQQHKNLYVSFVFFYGLCINTCVLLYICAGFYLFFLFKMIACTSFICADLCSKFIFCVEWERGLLEMMVENFSG